MTTRKVIRRRVRSSQNGIAIAADINAVISTGTGSATAVSRSATPIVQRRGRSDGRPDDPRRADG